MSYRTSDSSFRVARSAVASYGLRYRCCAAVLRPLPFAVVLYTSLQKLHNRIANAPTVSALVRHVVVPAGFRPQLQFAYLVLTLRKLMFFHVAPHVAPWYTSLFGIRALGTPQPVSYLSLLRYVSTPLSAYATTSRTTHQSIQQDVRWWS